MGRPTATPSRSRRTRSPSTTGSEEWYTNSLFPRTSTFCTRRSLRISLCLSLAGCCTSCAVRVKSGQINQPEALGISAELKSKGYALLCVGFPVSDLEVETQDEDEVRVQYQTLSVAANPGIMSPFVCVSFFLVKYYWHLQVYWLQFGRYFARGPIERDDYALELAMADE
ncbi:hypothetical protein SAY87_002543 [Trapa incisa]|uniref:2Fe-2S ferredoxin-type domain-containing protein n=1 Tax=Trapa incisa TaxID=236973 RepID=A0AAN7JWW7_9MYRT|nr:hypothetical protein SAY87_002543 [Trapa incisa]